MATCEVCGKEVALPFKCKYCGGTFCSDHRLPEKHSCNGFSEVELTKREQAEQGETPVRAPEVPPPIEIRYEIRTHRPRRTSFFRSLFHRASIAILLLIFLVFVGQLVAQAMLGRTYYITGNHSTFLYYLTPSQATVLTRPWTLMTHIFLHDISYPMVFLHLPVNALVLLSFGPLLEAIIGRRRFLLLFFGSGVIAGAAQIFVLPPNVVVLGASGAILGVLGTLTVLAPRLPVLFLFVPMPLWVVSLSFGVLSIVLALFAVGGTIGHTAHLTGLIIGLVYGYKLLREKRREYRYILRFSNPWA